jgi:hypothetical protein
MPWFSLMNVMRLGSWEILEGETSFEYCCQIDIAQQFCFPYRGTEDFYNIQGKVDFINSTLGKALGGASGKCQILLYIMRLAFKSSRVHCMCSLPLPFPRLKASIKTIIIMYGSLYWSSITFFVYFNRGIHSWAKGSG